MNGQISIKDALQLARRRQEARIAQMKDELRDLGFEGVVDAGDLWNLEANGFLVDFDSGLVEDAWVELDVEGAI